MLTLSENDADMEMHTLDDRVMKKSFADYYAPSEKEFERLWNESVIILDTNVLLNLYRLPAKSREEFISALESLKSKLWIPYHVGLEFQRRRLTVIGTERKSTEDALKFANEYISEMTSKIQSLQIEHRGLNIEPKPLLDDLNKAKEKLVGAVDAVHKSQIDIAASDPIRDRLDAIFADRVGKPPESIEELEACILDGEDRFNKKIPPGYSDAGKDKNPNEATFIHDQMTYQRKFGDLIIWRQIIDHVKKNNIKCVILVTADKKEDWWWREQGKTIGPQPELVREIQKLGGAELFWMYSADQFLGHASKYTKINVSQKAVAEIQEVVLHRSKKDDNPQAYDEASGFMTLGHTNGVLEFKLSAERGVFRWLRRGDKKVIATKDFPDFIVMDENDSHGYEVKAMQNPISSIFSPFFAVAAKRGSDMMKSGFIDKFTIIIVLPHEVIEDLEFNALPSKLQSRINQISLKSPISSILIGSITRNGTFRPFDLFKPELQEDAEY